MELIKAIFDKFQEKIFGIIDEEEWPYSDEKIIKKTFGITVTGSNPETLKTINQLLNNNDPDFMIKNIKKEIIKRSQLFENDIETDKNIMKNILQIGEIIQLLDSIKKHIFEIIDNIKAELIEKDTLDRTNPIIVQRVTTEIENYDKIKDIYQKSLNFMIRYFEIVLNIYTNLYTNLLKYKEEREKKISVIIDLISKFNNCYLQLLVK